MFVVKFGFINIKFKKVRKRRRDFEFHGNKLSDVQMFFPVTLSCSLLDILPGYASFCKVKQFNICSANPNNSFDNIYQLLEGKIFTQTN